jgi:hypothetical protein
MDARSNYHLCEKQKAFCYEQGYLLDLPTVYNREETEGMNAVTVKESHYAGIDPASFKTVSI